MAAEENGRLSDGRGDGLTGTYYEYYCVDEVIKTCASWTKTSQNNLD